MFKLVSSSYSKKSLFFVFFFVFCLFVLFQFSFRHKSFKFTEPRSIIANGFANNDFEPGSKNSLVSAQLSDKKETGFVSKYEEFPTLVKPHSENQFFVAPNVSSSGNGSINNPWDLKTVLSQPSSVKPGATIWLRGGTYKIPFSLSGFTSLLTGTLENPIKVISYPGEWAVIDGNLSNTIVKNKTIITNNGSYVWFMNFEITNTETSNRKITDSGSNPRGRRGSAIYDYGTGTKLINLVIHDTGQGIGAWQKGKDNEYYGNIVYNNGWDSLDRLHGHGNYTQNSSGSKTFEDNIFFNPFGLNSRMGGTQAASSRNYNWIGNVFFNGRMAWDGPNIENLRVLNNYTYNNPLKVGSKIDPTYINAEIRGNYLMSGISLYDFAKNVTFANNTVWNSDSKGKVLVINTKYVWNPARFLIDNNIYYKAFQNYPYWNFKINYRNNEEKALSNSKFDGFYAFNKTASSQQMTFARTKRSWQDDLRIDQNSTYIDSVPTKTQVFIKPNKYDSKRSHIIIYNWEQTNMVDVNVKSILRPGDSYELRNVQDYFNDVVSGTYKGGLLRISMNGRTRAKPIGYDQVSSWYHDPLQPHTFPTFGVFALIKNNQK